MVDYSKWANIQVSDDEDDVPNHLPIVTKLNSNQKVTIGPTGPMIENVQKNENITTSLDKEDDKDISYLCRNGSYTDLYHWDQGKNDITLRIKVPPTTQAKFVKITLLEDKTLIVTIANDIILNKKLKYTIILTDCIEDDSSFIDWELLTILDQKYIVLAFLKQSPIPNAIFWWDRVFEDDVPIDVTKLDIRLSSGTSNIGSSTTQATNAEGNEAQDTTATCNNTTSSSSNSVWDQAHAMFLEKIRSPDYKTTIDTDS